MDAFPRPLTSIEELCAVFHTLEPAAIRDVFETILAEFRGVSHEETALHDATGLDAAGSAEPAVCKCLSHAVDAGNAEISSVPLPHQAPIDSDASQVREEAELDDEALLLATLVDDMAEELAAAGVEEADIPEKLTEFGYDASLWRQAPAARPAAALAAAAAISLSHGTVAAAACTDSICRFCGLPRGDSPSSGHAAGSSGGGGASAAGGVTTPSNAPHPVAAAAAAAAAAPLRAAVAITGSFSSSASLGGPCAASAEMDPDTAVDIELCVMGKLFELFEEQAFAACLFRPDGSVRTMQERAALNAGELREVLSLQEEAMRAAELAQGERKGYQNGTGDEDKERQGDADGTYYDGEGEGDPECQCPACVEGRAGLSSSTAGAEALRPLGVDEGGSGGWGVGQSSAAAATAAAAPNRAEAEVDEEADWRLALELQLQEEQGGGMGSPAAAAAARPPQAPRPVAAAAAAPAAAAPFCSQGLAFPGMGNVRYPAASYAAAAAAAAARYPSAAPSAGAAAVAARAEEEGSAGSSDEELSRGGDSDEGDETDMEEIMRAVRAAEAREQREEETAVHKAVREAEAKERKAEKAARIAARRAERQGKQDEERDRLLALYYQTEEQRLARERASGQANVPLPREQEPSVRVPAKARSKHGLALAPPAPSSADSGNIPSSLQALRKKGRGPPLVIKARAVPLHGHGSDGLRAGNEGGGGSGGGGGNGSPSLGVYSDGSPSPYEAAAGGNGNGSGGGAGTLRDAGGRLSSWMAGPGAVVESPLSAPPPVPGRVQRGFVSLEPPPAVIAAAGASLRSISDSGGTAYAGLMAGRSTSVGPAAATGPSAAARSSRSACAAPAPTPMFKVKTLDGDDDLDLPVQAAALLRGPSGPSSRPAAHTSGLAAAEEQRRRAGPAHGGHGNGHGHGNMAARVTAEALELCASIPCVCRAGGGGRGGVVDPSLSHSHSCVSSWYNASRSRAAELKVERDALLRRAQESRGRGGLYGGAIAGDYASRARVLSQQIMYANEVASMATLLLRNPSMLLGAAASVGGADADGATAAAGGGGGGWADVSSRAPSYNSAAAPAARGVSSLLCSSGLPVGAPVTVDLHGQRVVEALRRLGEQIFPDAAGTRLETLRVITGAGRHNSTGDPTLREAVRKWLQRVKGVPLRDVYAWVSNGGNVSDMPVGYGAQASPVPSHTGRSVSGAASGSGISPSARVVSFTMLDGSGGFDVRIAY